MIFGIDGAAACLPQTGFTPPLSGFLAARKEELNWPHPH
jgi:hypothetical protein